MNIIHTILALFICTLLGYFNFPDDKKSGAVKVVTKAQVAKKLLKKKIVPNSKVVFGEEGQVLADSSKTKVIFVFSFLPLAFLLLFIDDMVLLKFFVCTLVSRDCVPFCKYIKRHVYSCNQGTHDKLN